MRMLRKNMKNGTKCIARTINLANPRTCVRPKQVQKFVNAELIASRPDSISNYWTPRPVAIKVCSRKDMQEICQPKLCDCPKKSPPLSSGEILCRTVMFLMKGVITAGLIYWTYSEGLWGDSAKTEDLYYRMMSTIAPSLFSQPDADNKEIKYSVSEAYNRTLVKVMDITVSVPLEMHRKLRDLLFPCDATEQMRAISLNHIDLKESNRTQENQTEI